MKNKHKKILVCQITGPAAARSAGPVPTPVLDICVTKISSVDRTSKNRLSWQGPWRNKKNCFQTDHLQPYEFTNSENLAKVGLVDLEVRHGQRYARPSQPRITATA